MRLLPFTGVEILIHTMCVSLLEHYMSFWVIFCVILNTFWVCPLHIILYLDCFHSRCCGFASSNQKGKGRRRYSTGQKVSSCSKSNTATRAAHNGQRLDAAEAMGSPELDSLHWHNGRPRGHSTPYKFQKS